MKKIFSLFTATLFVANTTFAGDYLTNTNYSVSFLRNPAQGANIDVTSIFSNPAGTAFLSKDGFQLSLNGMSAFQTRTIKSSSPFWTMDGKTTTETFEGKASAPFIPSFFAVYKKDKWAISGGFAVTGGGGKASFNDGLPMFKAMVISNVNKATAGALKPSMYNIDMALDGKQYIFGGQLGFSYRFNNWLSAYAGGRMNYYTGNYSGFINAATLQGNKPLAKVELDVDQTGWGLTPILGVDLNFDRFNFGVKYEFKTNMNIENKTNKLETGGNDAAFESYKNGTNTPSDLPAYLSVAGQYKILPSLRLNAEYHFFDDKNARMANDRQKELKHGTHEWLGGLEWDINDIITVSAGYQYSNYGLADAFQTDTNFYCDAQTVGLGARVHVTEALNLDLGYMFSFYKDYEKKTAYSADTYSRTNKVFGLAVNYSF